MLAQGISGKVFLASGAGGVPFHTQPVPGNNAADAPQDTAEVTSCTGHSSVKTDLRKSRNQWTKWRRGNKKSEKQRKEHQGHGRRKHCMAEHVNPHSQATKGPWPAEGHCWTGTPLRRLWSMDKPTPQHVFPEGTAACWEPTLEQALPEGTAAWRGPAMKQKETRKEQQRETTSPDHICHLYVDHCLTEWTVIICSDKGWGEQRSLEWRWAWEWNWAWERGRRDVFLKCVFVEFLFLSIQQ